MGYRADSREVRPVTEDDLGLSVLYAPSTQDTAERQEKTIEYALPPIVNIPILNRFAASSQYMALVPTPTIPGARISAQIPRNRSMSTGSRTRRCYRQWSLTRESYDMDMSLRGLGIMLSNRRYPQSRIASSLPYGVRDG